VEATSNFIIGTGIDFTPIAGDIKAIKETADDPTAVNIIATGVGFVPVVGDAAGKGLKTFGAPVADQIGNALTRTFSIEGRQVPLLGGDPVIGRTLKNGLVEIKTRISGSINDAADIFRRLAGEAAQALSNGAGFRAVLPDGREAIFRPKSTGIGSDGIPKIEIRDPQFGVSEKVNFTR
jgi:hypothetical protein